MTILHYSPLSGADGTLIPALTPTVGLGLVAVQGTWKVYSNQAYQDSPSVGWGQFVTQDTWPSADYKITVTVTPTTSAFLLFIQFRLDVGSDTYYAVKFDAVGGPLKVIETISGVSSDLFSGYFSPSSDTPINVEIWITGTAIRVWLDSTEIGSIATSPTITAAGDIGILQYGTASTTEGWHIQDLVVYNDASPSTFQSFDHMQTTAQCTAGDTSVIRTVYLRDSTTGAMKTGVVFSDLVCKTWIDGSLAATRTLVAMTSGTFTSLGLVERDATNQSGAYDFCPPDVDVNTQNHRYYQFSGTNIIGILDLTIFGSNALDPAISPSEINDDAIDKFLTFARPTNTTASIDNSAGPVAITVAVDPTYNPIAGLSPT
jgi:hypothetical protein